MAWDKWAALAARTETPATVSASAILGKMLADEEERGLEMRRGQRLGRAAAVVRRRQLFGASTADTDDLFCIL